MFFESEGTSNKLMEFNKRMDGAMLGYFSFDPFNWKY